MFITVPEFPLYLLRCLEHHGYRAYLVGGCVRDSLLEKRPDDWDIATNATPEQVLRCFSGEQVCQTGLRHGTVTVILNQTPYEITTFRKDGEYRDNRRPDQVTFVGELEEDLARRDFTVNAMAYHPEKGIIDPFGGERDLRSGQIACVGNPILRFQEDALRILRALRFAATLGFSIAPSTSEAILQSAHLLVNIAPERVRLEWDRIILGGGVARALKDYLPVVRVFLPEIMPELLDADWPRLLQVIANAPIDLVLRFAILYYCGVTASDTASQDRETGFGSKQWIVDGILRQLRYDNRTRRQIVQLIEYSDTDLPLSRTDVKQWLNRMGEEAFERLLTMRRLLCGAHGGDINRIEQAERHVRSVLSQQQCYRLKDLAIGGNDLLAAGIPQGKHVGVLLQQVLLLVMEEKVPNDRNDLIDAAKRQFEFLKEGIT